MIFSEATIIPFPENSVTPDKLVKQMIHIYNGGRTPGFSEPGTAHHLKEDSPAAGENNVASEITFIDSIPLEYKLMVTAALSLLTKLNNREIPADEQELEFLLSTLQELEGVNDEYVELARTIIENKISHLGT